MSYPLKNSNFQNRRKTARQKIILAFVFIIIILIILSTSWARRTLFYIANPVWIAESYVGSAFSNVFEHFKFKQTLIDEKQVMEEKLSAQTDLVLLNQVLQTENDNLKSLLGRKEIKHKSILAAVLVKPPKNLFDVLTIDIGSEQGVKVGDKVIADANVYIGEVTEVFSNNAKVTLYSSSNQKITVALGANAVSVEAIGRGNGNFMIELPREVGVQEGDVIFMPSITPNVFGIVEKILFEDKDSFQTVLFKSPVNIAELNFVEVLI